MAAAALVVMVHPDDLNLADAKALAAQHDAHVVANPYCPRGKAFLMPDPRGWRPGQAASDA